MCEHCDGQRQTLFEGPHSREDGVVVELVFDGDVPKIICTGYADGGFICGWAKLEINYCPMCGSKLGGDEK